VLIRRNCEAHEAPSEKFIGTTITTKPCCGAALDWSSEAPTDLKRKTSEPTLIMKIRSLNHALKKNVMNE
jgi:hypothetical protein